MLGILGRKVHFTTNDLNALNVILTYIENPKEYKQLASMTALMAGLHTGKYLTKKQTDRFLKLNAEQIRKRVFG